jgi:uncharacterized protein (TIGR03790 family)
VRVGPIGLAVAAAALAQGPENVLLVVNRASSVSGQIGEYYARRRGIPKVNVCRIDVPSTGIVPRTVYDTRIAAPVAACLKSRRLEEKVLYIVTTLGVPYGIAGGSGFHGDQAAVDSELALLYTDMHGLRHELSGPLPNPFFGHRDEPFRHPQFPIYLVCRLAAYSLEDVRAMIDRSLAAVNRGRVVLDMKEQNGGVGDDWLRNAAMLLPKGRAILDQTTNVLYGQRGVIGYASWGSNDPARKRRFLGFEWLPGAIVTEFVSTNGRTFDRPPEDWNISTWKDSAHWFSGSPQTLATDYLHEGATGASAHFSEPFLRLTPRPDFLFPAYLGGRTLAESYYLSIPALSWQNMVLGDPLCRLNIAR